MTVHVERGNIPIRNAKRDKFALPLLEYFLHRYGWQGSEGRFYDFGPRIGIAWVHQIEPYADAEPYVVDWITVERCPIELLDPEAVQAIEQWYRRTILGKEAT